MGVGGCWCWVLGRAVLLLLGILASRIPGYLNVARPVLAVLAAGPGSGADCANFSSHDESAGFADYAEPMNC